MTWLTETDRDSTPAGDRLAQLWAEPGILGLPGAHDPLAALLARRAGFRALYLSGAALAASLALPDLGILTLGELAYFTRAITERMQTRRELYELIGYHDYEALDDAIARSVRPDQGASDRGGP